MTLTQVRKYALSLGEATEEPHFGRTSFRVRKKIFLTAKASESHIHLFLPEAAREQALSTYPKFVSKLMWGRKVVGVRVDLPRANAAIVKGLIEAAWRSRAPKALMGSRAISEPGSHAKA